MAQTGQPPVTYDSLMSLCAIGDQYQHSADATVLYNLGVGYGRSGDPGELPFVFGQNVLASPSIASIFGLSQRTIVDSALNFSMLVHGAQRIVLHRPAPAQVDYVADERVVDVIDKGAGRGVLLLVEKRIRDKVTGEALCTLLSTVFARGDGGFGGPARSSPAPHRAPDRVADLIINVDVRPEQNFLYALSGDRNPLHGDPSAARLAGFPRPIVHGLCTYGMACQALVERLCSWRADLIEEFEARFAAPVFPGESLRMDVWRDRDVVSFELRAIARDIVVLSNGRCKLRG